ncbi:GDSL lipase/esterase [Dillenia turbinata]|uniref:GDSL lipase/esterase n=1 Tax=Dillenia turbinata TaxID=194707 RepID=A0AAN8W6C8_9MAGN
MDESDPAQFTPFHVGFESAVVACCATRLLELGYLCNKFSHFTCTDANKYVFWDSFHPSEKTYAIIASHLVKTSLAEFL